MPDTVGMKLDAALIEIANAGIDGEPEVEGGGLFGVVDESNWVVCEQVPAAGAPGDSVPTLSVDRECGDASSASPEPSETASASPEPSERASASGSSEPPASEEPSAPTDEPQEYAYAGPEYEIVTIDYSAGLGEIDQYWVLIDPVDTGSEAYREDFKAIITDIAHQVASDHIIVQIVSDPEIIEAESNSTIADFMESHGMDYYNDVVRPKEETHWVAWFSGGIDANELVLSDADSAFEIVWWPAGDTYEPEQWRPEA